MRKITMLATAILIVALLSAPVLAAMRVISDTFYRGSGTGVAVVQVSSNLFAKIVYLDIDGSESFTSRDQRLRIEYISRGFKPKSRSLEPNQLERG